MSVSKNYPPNSSNKISSEIRETGNFKEIKPSQKEPEKATKGGLEIKKKTEESVKVSVEWLHEDPILSRLQHYATVKASGLEQAKRGVFNDSDRHLRLTFLDEHSGVCKMGPTLLKFFWGERVFAEIPNISSKKMILTGENKKNQKIRVEYFKKNREVILEKMFCNILGSCEKRNKLLHVNRKLYNYSKILNKIEKEFSIPINPLITISALCERIIKVNEITADLIEEHAELLEKKEVAKSNGKKPDMQLLDKIEGLQVKIDHTADFDVDDFFKLYQEKEALLHSYIPQVRLRESPLYTHTEGICIGIVLDLIDLVENGGMGVEQALKDSFQKGGRSHSSANQSLFKNLQLKKVNADEIEDIYTLNLPQNTYNQDAIRFLIKEYRNGSFDKETSTITLEKFGRERLDAYPKSDGNSKTTDNDIRWAIACFALIKNKKTKNLNEPQSVEMWKQLISPSTKEMFQTYKKGLKRFLAVSATASSIGLEVEKTSSEMREAELKNHFEECLDALSTLERGSYLLIFDTDSVSHAILINKMYDDDTGPLYMVDPNGFALKCADVEDSKITLKKLINFYNAPVINDGKRFPQFIKLKADSNSIFNRSSVSLL